MPDPWGSKTPRVQSSKTPLRNQKRISPLEFRLQPRLDQTLPPHVRPKTYADAFSGAHPGSHSGIERLHPRSQVPYVRRLIVRFWRSSRLGVRGIFSSFAVPRFWLGPGLRARLSYHPQES